MNLPDILNSIKGELKKATDNGQPAFTPAQVDAIANAIYVAVKKTGLLALLVPLEHGYLFRHVKG